MAPLSSIIGGPGNDNYVVDNAGDVVTKKSGSPYAAPSGWKLKGTADFNHDGVLDVALTNGASSEFQLLSGSGAVL